MACGTNADGKGVWSWCPGLVLCLWRRSTGDGDQKVTDTGECTKEPVNTIAQGMPVLSAKPLVNALMSFFHSYMRPWVWLKPPAFPAPCFSWGDVLIETSGISCRGNMESWLLSLAAHPSRRGLRPLPMDEVVASGTRSNPRGEEA